MEKPSRFLLDRVASYADEAGAYLRRRRLRSRPFARVWRSGGRIDAPAVDSPDGRRLSDAAAALIAIDTRLP